MSFRPRNRAITAVQVASPFATPMYRGKYADREQAYVMRQAQNRAWHRRRRGIVEEPEPVRHPAPLGDVRRSVYLPPAGSIAFSLLYQVAR